MRNHWALSLFFSTVWFWPRVERVLQLNILWQFQFHVSRSGVRIPVKAIFVMWLQWQLILINQSKKLFKKYSPLIDRCRKLREGKEPKKLPWMGFEPQTWKHGVCSGIGTATVRWHARHAVKPRCRGKERKRPMIPHCFTQCSNGSSLGSFLFPVKIIRSRGVRSVRVNACFIKCRSQWSKLSITRGSSVNFSDPISNQKNREKERHPDPVV